ncbi:hypothetical protein PInf_029032 [Phytophthora infestans]|nr:hypothetical protein PInf_029032 [Phytophthora infestans]
METQQDEALARAYLDLSQNAIQGAEQKAASFWDSILNRFNTATKPKKEEQLVDDNKERNSVLFEQMKRKNDLIEEQLTMDLFKTDPNSEESKTFFSFMRKKRLASIMDGEAAH